MPEEKSQLTGKNENVGFKVSLMPQETSAPDPAARLRLFYRILIIGCALVLLATGGLWLAVYLQQAEVVSANATIATLDKKLSDLGATYDAAKKEQDVITALSGLFANHIYSSKVFTLLEADTLPLVSWNTLNFTASGAISLAGTASDYDALVAQVQTIKNDPAVASVSFSGVNADFDEKGVMKGISFNLNIKINPDYLLNATK